MGHADLLLTLQYRLGRGAVGQSVLRLTRCRSVCCEDANLVKASVSRCFGPDELEPDGTLKGVRVGHADLLLTLQYRLGRGAVGQSVLRLTRCRSVCCEGANLGGVCFKPFWFG